MTACDDGDTGSTRLPGLQAPGPKADDTEEKGAAEPEFIAPVGERAQVELGSGQCLEIELEIDDVDSAEIDLSVDAPNAIAGATLTEDAGGHLGQWRWCPGAFGNPPPPGLYEIVLLADDGDHMPAAKRFEVEVVEGSGEPEPDPVDPGGDDCDSGWPTLDHPDPMPVAESGNVRVAGFFKDDEGITGFPIVTYTFNEPVEGEMGGDVVETPMELYEGDREAGLWIVEIPMEGTDVWYRLGAGDDYPASPCAHWLEEPPEGWYHFAG